MKTLGIIGGFGPEATAQFYRLLTAKTRARIIVRHVTVPRIMEHDALVLGKNILKFRPLLVDTAKRLERDGADIIVLPCNTLHIHENAIRQAIHIPFISIVDETTKRLHNITRLGFLGSRITIRKNLFQKKLKATEFVTVPPALQQRMDRGLDEFVDTGNNALLRNSLHTAFTFLRKQGVSDVLVACTDFHGLCPNTLRIHDTLDILVEATVNVL